MMERNSIGERVTRGAAKRTLEAEGQEMEKEKDAMVAFVVKDLAAELYVELPAGLHQ
jgi:hypothetical protein